MLEIREASLKDVPEIVRLWTEFMGHHDKLVLKENKKLKSFLVKRKNAADKYKEFLQEHFKLKKGTVFLAEVDDTIVGFTLVIVKDEIPIFEIKKIGYVSDLFVKEKFRKLGISSKLRDEAITWFKKKGLKHMSIGLYNDNKFARSVYKRWGFFDYKIEMRRQI